MYYREHKKSVSSFDEKDTVGYVRKNKTSNAQIEANERYNARFDKIFIRIPPSLKQEFMQLCEENNISMNREILSLIIADIESY